MLVVDRVEQLVVDLGVELAGERSSNVASQKLALAQVLLPRRRVVTQRP